jgi:hypothetical protein
MDKLPCDGWLRHVIISNHPTLVFEPGELSNVVTRELQSNTRSKTIVLSDEQNARILERLHQGFGITPSGKPCAAACLEALERLDRNSRSTREMRTIDSSQDASGQNQTASKPGLDSEHQAFRLTR